MDQNSSMAALTLSIYGYPVFWSYLYFEGLHMIENHLNKAKNGLVPEINTLVKNERPLVLFGAGATGAAVLENCLSYHIKVDCFCDNNPAKHGEKHAGLDVISYQTLKEKYKDCNLILTIGTPDAKDVKNQLNQDGFFRIFPFDKLLFDILKGRDYIIDNLGRFEKLYAMLEDERSRRVLTARLNYIISADSAELESVQTSGEYFDASIFDFTKDEYFIDAGALDGQTALEFARTVPNFRRIVCFEPDANNFIKTRSKIESLPRTRAYPLGLWSGSTTLRFQSNGGGSCINADGEESVEVTALDETLSGEPITLIKMDIEGAEVEAINGAAHIIQSQKPKLAICVYHRQEDILDIPFLLKQLVPEYKIYLRHHSPSLLDTVCYATL